MTTVKGGERLAKEERKTGRSRFILVVDDEQGVHYSFQRLLEDLPIEVRAAQSGEEAIEILRKEPVDVVIMDIRMGGKNGLETLREMKRMAPKVVVLMMTAYGTSHTAIEAMKLGAYDYILKPFDIPELRHLIERSLEAAQLAQEEGQTAASGVDRQGPALVGDSPPMQKVYKLVGQVSKTNATVLITGESGTGKELIARAIYQHSMRANKPFIAINCAAIPENLLESELFGHERGSFTGAMAQRIGKFEQGDGGTIFLDEIGEMPLTTQSKILRVLQEGEVSRLGSNEPIRTDVRVIAATNKDLATAVQRREFRADLFYRLNVVRVSLPPLKDRAEDIPVLAAHFLQKHRRYLPQAAMRISADAMRALQAYPWPGNIRELENVIQRAMVLAASTTIEVSNLPEEIQEVLSANSREHPSAEGRVVEEAVRALSDLVLRNGVTDLGPRILARLVDRIASERGGDERRAAELLGFRLGDLHRLGSPQKLRE
ncbi:Nitrogen regulation protein NR(I) [Methylacidimicrobium cyclopophantes]|uniref:Nitrogen regulation protein NR(I) n=1 Tax=Methylacidimicrobium cyclopophantes TaxID=1041766 RepID=A0A5E6MKF3_9BACT|nr:sigma-54 dependent transcriptional regulator [Methylacidimicrobium cyclopophantes]VVM08457.1 Nitrogen regulation protein NR(I) [Methylacidimicrobium cyclopophantes]